MHHIILNHKPSTLASTATVRERVESRESSRVELYFNGVAVECFAIPAIVLGQDDLYYSPYLSDHPERSVNHATVFYRAFYCICQMLDSAEHSVIFFDSCGKTELYLESRMKKVILVVIRNNTLFYSLLLIFSWSLWIST